MSKCQDTRQHHSDDTVTVYVGRPEPVTLCGYHAHANVDSRSWAAGPTCSGCFNVVTGPADHARGCPTGQNGAPNYN